MGDEVGLDMKLDWLLGKKRAEERTAEEWHNRGNELNDSDRYEEAINCFNKALEINPKFQDALVEMGKALTVLDRKEEAINCFDKALEIDPSCVETLAEVGLALAILGRYDESNNCFDKAIKIDPNNYFIWLKKGIKLNNLGRYDESNKCFDKSLERNPFQDYDIWYLKGNVLINLGKYLEAIKCFDKALVINKGNKDAIEGRKIAEAKMEEEKKMEKCCFDAIISVKEMSKIFDEMGLPFEDFEKMLNEAKSDYESKLYEPHISQIKTITFYLFKP